MQEEGEPEHTCNLIQQTVMKAFPTDGEKHGFLNESCWNTQPLHVGKIVFTFRTSINSREIKYCHGAIKKKKNKKHSVKILANRISEGKGCFSKPNMKATGPSGDLST